MDNSLISACSKYFHIVGFILKIFCIDIKFGLQNSRSVRRKDEISQHMFFECPSPVSPWNYVKIISKGYKTALMICEADGEGKS